MAAIRFCWGTFHAASRGLIPNADRQVDTESKTEVCLEACQDHGPEAAAAGQFGGDEVL